MKTIIIPIDFSATSNNVLKYAAAFACDHAVEKVILLNTFYVSIYEQILPSVDFIQRSDEEIETERKQQEIQLEVYKTQLAEGCNFQVEVEKSDEPLLRAIHASVSKHEPDLVMVGSDAAAEETYIGEMVIEITKSLPVPVLIVPSNSMYQKIIHALVGCDFRSLEGIGLLKHLQGPSTWLHARLSVVNVNPDHASLPRKQDYEMELARLLECYPYEVFNIEDRNIVRGILDFANEYDVQLIVALPKKHSFFYTLTNASISQALALNATKPVLILK